MFSIKAHIEREVKEPYYSNVRHVNDTLTPLNIDFVNIEPNTFGFLILTATTSVTPNVYLGIGGLQLFSFLNPNTIVAYPCLTVIWGTRFFISALAGINAYTYQVIYGKKNYG